MSDLISKSRLKKELSKIPSEMGLIKKAWVMRAIDKQKTQDSNNNCNCQHDSRHTNADRIRNMSDEELAELLFDKSRCDNCFANCNDKDNCPSLGSCYSRHLEWLQSEAE